MFPKLFLHLKQLRETAAIVCIALPIATYAQKNSPHIVVTGSMQEYCMRQYHASELAFGLQPSFSDCAGHDWDAGGGPTLEDLTSGADETCSVAYAESGRDVCD
ncbi:hypothetical protein C8Q76DRAFT_746777 [Earliella scabrosa]|nr:hypothetical protein C8Q76DRAFT_746777 [Earliella scabrosa]